MPTRSPFVYWSQDQKNIYFRVDINNAKNIDTYVVDYGKTINFSATNLKDINYEFNLKLSGKAKNEITVKQLEQKVELTIPKNEEGSWQSLIDRTVYSATPPWLKIDFERWQVEDSENEDENLPENEDYAKLIKYLDADGKQRDLSELMTPELLRKLNMVHGTYLCGYNVCMFFAHFYVLSFFIADYITRQDGEPLSNLWESRSAAIWVCYLLQLMEVIHSISGLVKSSWQATVMKVCGRLAIIWIVSINDGIKSWPPVYVLIMVYFLVEQFRYPFYALSSLGITVPIITWLRYSAFLILYPIGFTMEGLILVRSAFDFSRNGQYSLELPNPFNITFNFGIILAIFSITVFPYIFISLFCHRRKQRQTKLASNKSYKPKKMIEKTIG